MLLDVFFQIVTNRESGFLQALGGDGLLAFGVGLAVKNVKQEQRNRSDEKESVDQEGPEVLAGGFARFSIEILERGNANEHLGEHDVEQAVDRILHDHDPVVRRRVVEDVYIKEDG